MADKYIRFSTGGAFHIPNVGAAIPPGRNDGTGYSAGSLCDPGNRRELREIRTLGETSPRLICKRCARAEASGE